MTDQNQLTPEEEKATDTVNVSQDAKGLVKSVSVFLSELLDIRDETDREQTIEGIKADIPFKGHIAWILIFAVFIASIGLNVSSTAVVIGAMLISPLMGPILGVGMSLAIFDMQTLKRSLVNLGVMVGLSVFTAFLYFKLSPLTELTPELEARTSPNILDVFVAIFGGLALIVAKSKKGTMASVIFGVAIATALMPPLCTVGYGLAVWEPRFFAGAMYLFCINTIFIALSTFLVAKALRFPLVKYANAEKRKRIKWTITTIALLAMLPASKTFYDVWKESNFNRDVKSFVVNEIKGNKELQLLETNYDYKTQTIELDFYSHITEVTKADLLNELKGEAYPNLHEAKLKIKGSNTDNFELVKDLLAEKRKEVQDYRKEINSLEQQVAELEKTIEETSGQKPLDYLSISKDAKIEFSELNTITFATELKSNFRKIDTMAVARPNWKTSLTDSLSKDRDGKLSSWLKNQMKVDTVYVK